MEFIAFSGRDNEFVVLVWQQRLPERHT